MDWNKLQETRLAVVAELVSRAPAGHIGRTALMKFCYLLQVVRGVPLGYHFTLYSYGPFDSGVLSDLSTAETLKAVESTVVYYGGGYGYQIKKGERGDAIIQSGRNLLDLHKESIDWVLSEFGSHGSADLELESTIVYADREAAKIPEELTIPALVQRVRDVKPRFVESYILEKVLSLRHNGLLQNTQPVAAGS